MLISAFKEVVNDMPISMRMFSEVLVTTRGYSVDVSSGGRPRPAIPSWSRTARLKRSGRPESGLLVVARLLTLVLVLPCPRPPSLDVSLQSELSSPHIPTLSACCASPMKPSTSAMSPRVTSLSLWCESWNIRLAGRRNRGIEAAASGPAGACGE